MRAIFREFKPDAVIHLAACAEDDPDAACSTPKSAAPSPFSKPAAQHFEQLDGDARAALPHRPRRPRADTDDAGAPTPAEAARAAAAALVEHWSQRPWPARWSTCVAGDVFGPWQADNSLPARLIASLLSRPHLRAAPGRRDRARLAAGPRLRRRPAPRRRSRAAAVALRLLGRRRTPRHRPRRCRLRPARRALAHARRRVLVGPGQHRGRCARAVAGPMLDSDRSRSATRLARRGASTPGSTALLNWALAPLCAARARRPSRPNSPDISGAVAVADGSAAKCAFKLDRNGRRLTASAAHESDNRGEESHGRIRRSAIASAILALARRLLRPARRTTVRLAAARGDASP